tara:strand:+ start:1279 stop:2940 length:1662 start_codon:yes stop_codon:yes gene_type:complete
MPESRIKNIEDSKRGLYPSVFKKIDQSDVKINPFRTHKKFSIQSGSASSSLLPLEGKYIDTNILPAIGSELTYNDEKNIDGSLKSVTYFSINHLFYKRKNEPYNIFGPNNNINTKKFLYQTASIFSIPQNKVGEGIKLASFNITASEASTYTSAVYGGSVYGIATFGGSGSLQDTLLISSDRYGNLFNSQFVTSSIITDVKFYEGFNEYFDKKRILYEVGNNVEYIDGITTSNGLKKPIGLSAEFSGSGYIKTNLDGLYDRNNDYSISLFVSASNTSSDNKLIITKASSSITTQYPFKLELDTSNQLLFSAGGSTKLKTQITSSIGVNEWTHVVCQKTGSKLEMYLNGILHSEVTSTILQDNTNPLVTSARIDNKWPLYIGGYTNSNYLQGKIDEIRIFNKGLSSTEVGYLGDRTEDGTVLQTNQIGNIFDKQGIAVVSTPDYRFHNLIDLPYTASYRSTKTIHELNVVAKIDGGDFNMSSNLSLTKDDDTTYKTFVSQSSFAPYITTIGLYNDAGQLLAIAKTANAIRKRPDVDMNFVIQIDLDKNINFKDK